jgi:hypothetical protein
VQAHQDSGILEEMKWAWWKRILAIPEKMAKAKMVTNEPSSSHLRIRKMAKMKKWPRMSSTPPTYSKIESFEQIILSILPFCTGT